jgi:hypothetical protein
MLHDPFADVQDTPLLRLGLSSDGCVRSRFHAFLRPSPGQWFCPTLYAQAYEAVNESQNSNSSPLHDTTTSAKTLFGYLLDSFSEKQSEKGLERI